VGARRRSSPGGTRAGGECEKPRVGWLRRNGADTQKKDSEGRIPANIIHERRRRGLATHHVGSFKQDTADIEAMLNKHEYDKTHGPKADAGS